MKKIFKIIIENSNALLIFITIIALVMIIHTSLESNGKASTNLVKAVILYTELINDNAPKDEQYRELIESFDGSYFGSEGREVTALLAGLETRLPGEESAEDILNLIALYQKMIENRTEFFNTLFYFLIIGIGIQFAFMIVSIRKYTVTHSRLETSEEVIQLLNTAREKERLRISSFLHDSILQEIGSLLLHKEMQKCTETSTELRRISDSLRDLTYSIAPLHLNSAGLADTIAELSRDFESETGIKTSFSVTAFKESQIDADVRLVFFRIAQEALNNIKKHSKAENAVIRLASSHPYLILRIKDDGSGFAEIKQISTSNQSEHLGMRLMKEQAKSIGATVSGESIPGTGTEISLKYRITGRSS